MEKILYLGETGVGKSRAVTKLDPETTILVQCTKKRLPNAVDKKYIKGKNRFLVSTNEQIVKVINGISTNEDFKHIKTIVIDDWSFASMKELMARSNERGFDKFTDVALGIVNVINAVDHSPREDVDVVFITHLEHELDGSLDVKTGSKFIKEKWGLIEQFEIVLVGNRDYTIKTNGQPAKSPEGMFEEIIENDLQKVLDRIKEYYGGEDDE